MLACINKSSKEFRDLKEMSGLPEQTVEALCRKYTTTLGRFPYIDELPGANSEPHLIKKLGLSRNGATSIENLLNITGKNSVDGALTDLNNTYRDLQVSGVALDDDTIIINIEHRPSLYRSGEVQRVTQDNRHSALIVDDICDKLSSLYGIPIVSLTTLELQEQLPQIPDSGIAKAFIYNNVIYVNTDNATLDSRVHELLHILFGSMKYSNPDLYYSLVKTAEQFETDSMKFYKGRTKGDILEEVFVTELAKFLVDMPSQIDNLSELQFHEINYQMNRILDAAFMGDYSTRSIDQRQLLHLSLSDIGRYVNSALTNQSFKGSISDAEVSRILSNQKVDLIKKGELKEYC